MQNNTITFEQPVNELIRVCLRLEYLQQTLDHFLAQTHELETKACLNALIDTLTILDRPDLKNKLTQELNRIVTNFQQLQQTPEVNHQLLADVIDELQGTLHSFEASNGKFGQALRENEFLNTIRQCPGGACNFNVASLSLWLKQDPNQRTADIQYWLDELNDVNYAVQLFLRLIRQSSIPNKQTAASGFYQTTLDSQTPCQLIQVTVATSYNVFPQISVGRHGISVSFLENSLSQHPLQTQKDIEFKLQGCVL